MTQDKVDDIRQHALVPAPRCNTPPHIVEVGKPLQLRELRPTHTTKLLASIIVRRIADTRCTTRGRNFCTAGQMQIGLTQKLQRAFIRMTLPCHANLPNCQPKGGTGLGG